MSFGTTTRTQRTTGSKVGSSPRMASLAFGTIILVPSAIKPVLATLEQSLVIQVLGTLTPRDQIGLKALIPQLVG
jgi:hypothetical protein